MPGDDGVKKGKRKQKDESLQDALRQLDEAKQAGLAAVRAAEEVAAARQQLGQHQGYGGGNSGGNEGEMPQQFIGSLSDLDVNFDPMSAPPPAFAGVCVVHRFPEYVLIDFGSIDPLRVEPTGPGAGRAMLQHVGRLCLPVSVAKRLVQDLGRTLGD
jgi:hypothetical protein